MSWFDEAKEKLVAEKESAGWGQKERAMAGAVRKALTEFCRQSEDFAQNVAHGGSFEECMKAVAKGVGSSISDIEAYRRAVKFYAKGCTVRFKMEIVAEAAEKEEKAQQEKTPEKKATVIDLTAFL